MKRSTLKKTHKPKSEARVLRTRELHLWFQELWSKLPEEKHCTICNKRIWGECSTIYFDHLIEKEHRWDIAFEEWNIAFVCGDCHTCRNNGFPKPKHKELIKQAKEYDNKIQTK